MNMWIMITWQAGRIIYYDTNVLKFKTLNYLGMHFIYDKTHGSIISLTDTAIAAGWHMAPL